MKCHNAVNVDDSSLKPYILATYKFSNFDQS